MNTNITTTSNLRNWLELPEEVTAKILGKLGSVDILESMQKVCPSWRKICKDSSMFRRIVISNSSGSRNRGLYLINMCRHIVDRSDGQLIEFNIEYFGTNELLHYVAERSSGLKRIRLVASFGIKDDGFIKAVAKFPLLEEIEITHCMLTKKAIESVGKSCPMLKTFKFNTLINSYPDEPGYEEAAAIAKNMPGLHHLQIVGCKLTDNCLKAILKGCPHLESLDLRDCDFLHFNGNLKKTLADQVKSLKLPRDPIDDIPIFVRAHAAYERNKKSYDNYDYFNAGL
ncbi:hypothetical protein ACFE04_029862 [Oxalis oulophora]